MPVPAQSPVSRRLGTARLPQPGRRTLAALVAGLLLLLGLGTGPVSVARADGPIGTPDVRDALSVSGYDSRTERRADVVVGSTDNNLVFRYVAGRALLDGTMIVSLPAKAWPTPLHPEDRLWDDNPASRGGVAVRPLGPDDQLDATDCRGTGDQPISTQVLNTSTRRLAVVSHLACGPGQQITVRVFGVEAPSAVGRYRFGVSVSDRSGQRGPSTLGLAVVPKPKTTLRLDVPELVQVEASTPVLVRALLPNGRINPAYRGSVNLLDAAGKTCIFTIDTPSGLVDFTAADAGVKVVDVTFQHADSTRMRGYDVAHRANAGVSDPYSVFGTPQNNNTCSVSYH